MLDSVTVGMLVVDVILVVPLTSRFGRVVSCPLGGRRRG